MLPAPVDTLTYDAERVARWQSQSAYDYNRELLVPEETFMDWLDQEFSRWVDKVFGSGKVSEYSETVLIIVAVLILLLIIWFVYKKNPGWFMASHKSKLSYTVEEDTIYGVDFDANIAGALARGEYREAIRLLYLQTLKRLSDEKRIEWKLYKTPTQYIYEVKQPLFRQLSNHFMRVRYGNFEADEALFAAMKQLQTALFAALSEQESEKGGEA